MNYKTEQQYLFQHSINTLSQQFSNFQSNKSTSKLTQAKVAEFSDKLKNLNNVFMRMDEVMKKSMKNRNFNQFDIRNKLKKYEQDLQKIKDRFRKLQDKILDNQKNELMKDRNLNPGQISNFQRQNQHLMRAQNINKQAEQVHGIVTATNEQLLTHRQKLKQIDNDAGQFQHQLTMVGQLLQVITNRQLATKLILVLLVFFLGLADVLILLIKVLGR